jgi:hypothetical protein
MGLFGDLDANEVSDDPFYIPPDVYRCVLTEASRNEKKNPKPDDLSKEGLSFKWVIEDEDSDFDGYNKSDWHNLYTDVSEDEVTVQVRRDNARLKKRLGEMGLTPDEMNNLLEDDNLAELVGIVANVEITETPDKNDPDKKWSNIAKVTRLDLDD